MSASIARYLDLVPPEHASKPNFIAFISIFLQGMADAAAVLASMPGLFDLDYAVGDQEDKVGQRVGRTRYLNEPLDVYFSWDTPGLGWGQGVWQDAYNPSSGLVRLDDDQYRTLLRATVAANQWDGTIPGAYAALNTLFGPLGYNVLIQDQGDRSFLVALQGPALDALTEALFTTGELDLKPGGIALTHVTQTVAGADVPFFGWGVENSAISGWGAGAWGAFSSPE